MKVGVVFPQTEIGADPGAVRQYAQAAEELGYDHILAYDHVLGANAASRPGWQRPYQHTDMFHEIFVLFGYLAGITQRIELVSGVLILPQRQTALVAKQAAAVDVLSGGRMRLGIGIGWNDVEYEALGENFHNRGSRSEEQIEVLRALWTNEAVTYEGRWHTITDAGVNPLPIQRPIPIWIGGGPGSAGSISEAASERVLRRIGRMGDGWFPQVRPDERGRASVARLHEYAREAGRDPAEIGMEGRVNIARGGPEEWLREVAAWRDIGATHLSVGPMGAGLSSPDGLIDAIRRFKEAFDRS